MLQLNLPHTAKPIVRQRKYSIQQVDRWVEMYKEGLSLREIAERENANHSSVPWNMRKRGISDSRKTGRKKKYTGLSKREAQKNFCLKSLYGVDLEWYKNKLEEQNGVCAICKQPPSSASNQFGVRALAVDHDHDTGKVRGLLCASCNTGLGKFKDSSGLLEAATEYLVRG